MDSDQLLYLKLTQEEIQVLSGGHLNSLLERQSNVLSCIKEVMLKWNSTTYLSDKPQWMTLVNLFSTKLSLTSCSLTKLAIQDNNISESVTADIFELYRARDLSSLCTLARAQIEAYLTFFYLFIQPDSDHERDLRSDIYILQSLNIRQNVSDISAPDLLEKKQKEAQQIIEIQNNLKSNPIFLGYETQLKESILKGRYAKRKGWETLMSESKIYTPIIKNLYDLYANHAHSEYISIIQLQSNINNPAYLEKITSDIIRISVSILSLFLREASSLLKIQDTYNTLDNMIKFKMRLWTALLTNSHDSTMSINLL